MNKITKSVRRFDLGEMREAELTPQGFLKVPGFATRTGVFPYVDGDGQVRRELRHPDDVFDPVSLKTLQYAPVTIEHPPVMLDPTNVAQYSKGHTTERVEVNRDMVDVDLIVEHADAISAIQDGGLRELSSGYLADIEEEEGTYNGAPYNFRQRNIKYNHLAMVKRGRAGPEVRMRLDSADAVMRNDEVSVPSAGVNTQESSVNDGEIQAMKKLVVCGQEIELPSEIADTMQDMLDRYDEMRAKLSELEEKKMAEEKESKKSDVDVNQKGVSPQVDVKQAIPDGKNAGGKIGPGAKTVHPDAEEKEDEDEKEEKKGDEESEEKEDFESGKAGAGGGAALSPVDQMKKDAEEMKAKLDGMQAKIDEYAAASMSQGEAKPDRMDSVDKRVKERVRLLRQAEKLVPREVAQKFDSMTDSKIRAAVIKHKHPKADLDGKSEVYLQSRFDSIVEATEESASAKRSEAGRSFLGLDNQRTDSMGEVDPNKARRDSIAASRDLWKQNLSGFKK